MHLSLVVEADGFDQGPEHGRLHHGAVRVNINRNRSTPAFLYEDVLMDYMWYGQIYEPCCSD